MEHLSYKRKITIMIAIIAAMFFSAINQTIVGTALPRIIAKLGGMDYYTWVITIYLLTSTIATVLVGKLSDIYGRKPFILTGIVLFMIGALMAGTSADIFQLITYRGIQGLGAGIIMATAFTAVGDLFAPRERGKWSGIMMSVFGFASVVGPALGGYIVDHLEWHWVFWIFLPLGIVAFIMILTMFPKVERKPAESIDYFGSLFLTLTIVPMLLAFSWAGTKYAWGSPQIIGLFACTLAALVIFLWIESRVNSPVLPLSLFKNGIVTISNVIGFIMNAGMMGALMYTPFFVQGVMGISPTYSGYVTMPMSIGMVVTSSISGQLITKTGKYKRIAIIGLAIMVIGMIIMHYMNTISVTVLSMVVFGFGLGLGMPVFSLTVQNAVSPKDLGVATASSQLFRSLGGTIGIAVMGTVMSTGMTNKLQEILASGRGVDLSKLDPKVAEKLAAFHNPQMLLDQPKLAQIQAALPPELQTVFSQMIDSLREALSYSLANVFLAGAALLVVALLLTFFLKEIPLRTGSGGQGPKPQEAAETDREPAPRLRGKQPANG
ncbi:MFS transporter [Paenibacillus elgii]|uniref:MFS transporter n=1 Tax=Paenibacillus elgii TaxID=189691 RepID=A0A2T6G8Q6_9BACL|nr:MDR family MFS transporter [Paenibacillus elgii]PUA40543.1 MFS transporter [Paenibacillus elgii]